MELLKRPLLSDSKYQYTRLNRLFYNLLKHLIDWIWIYFLVSNLQYLLEVWVMKIHKILKTLNIWIKNCKKEFVRDVSVLVWGFNFIFYNFYFIFSWVIYFRFFRKNENLKSRNIWVGRNYSANVFPQNQICNQKYNFFTFLPGVSNSFLYKTFIILLFILLIFFRYYIISSNIFWIYIFLSWLVHNFSLL